MKRSIALALFSLLLVSVCSARLLTFEGSTTIKLSGQLKESMAERIYKGETLRVLKSYSDGFVTMPMYLYPQKNGSWSFKDKLFKISFKPKNKKYSYSDKSYWNLVFAIGTVEEENFEVAEADKGSTKCSGTLHSFSGEELENYSIGINDGYPETEDICGGKLEFKMEAKGKKYVFTKKEPGCNIKITLKAKGHKISASFKLSEGYVEPIFDKGTE